VTGGPDAGALLSTPALAALGALLLLGAGALWVLLRTSGDDDPRAAARRDAPRPAPQDAPPPGTPPTHAPPESPSRAPPEHLDDETVLGLLAAHAAEDPAYLRRACVRHGLVDPKSGHPRHEAYARYVEGVKRLTMGDMDRYARFVAAANGRWRAAAEEILRLDEGA